MWSTEDAEHMCDELLAAKVKNSTWEDIGKAIDAARKFQVEPLLLALVKQCPASVGVALTELLTEYYRPDIEAETRNICQEVTSHERWLAGKGRPGYLLPTANLEKDDD